MRVAQGPLSSDLTRDLHVRHWPGVRSNMAGYWPRSFFPVFMERHKDELFKNVRNNEANTKLSGPNRLSLISQYRIYHIAKKKVSLTKPTRETASGHELVHFASSDSQSDHRIRFIMPARGFRHIIKNCLGYEMLMTYWSIKQLLLWLAGLVNLVKF